MRSNWGGNSGYSGGSWLPFSWHAIPVTRALLLGTVSVFLLFFFTGQFAGPVWEWIPFRAGGMEWVTRPWTWVTYAFMEVPSLWVILTLYVLYSMGGMLERSWGSRNFAVLFFAFTAIGALALAPAALVFGKSVELHGLTLPLMALVTAWAALDPEQEISFWGIPMKAKLLAAIWVALNYFSFGLQYQNPLLAVFSLAPAAAAWLYVRKMPRLSVGYRAPQARTYREPLLRDEPPLPRGIEREQVKRGFNPLRKRQEQLEIERLRKLLGDDDDRPIRRH
jgi:membrane associated rhomboid family serine protease